MNKLFAIFSLFLFIIPTGPHWNDKFHTNKQIWGFKKVFIQAKNTISEPLDIKVKDLAKWDERLMF